MPTYFLTIRLPYAWLDKDAWDAPDRAAATHEEKVRVFYEVDSQAVAENLAGVFRHDKPAPGVQSAPNAPLATTENAPKLVENASQPIFGLVGAEDLNLAQRVLFREALEFLARLAGPNADTKRILDEAGLPDDRGTISASWHHDRARQREPLVREQLAAGTGSGFYLWWTWGEAHPEDPRQAY